MTTENKHPVTTSAVTALLKECGVIVERDIHELAECDNAGGCGESHAAEISSHEALLGRIERFTATLSEDVAERAADLAAALLYGEFCEANYAASWLEPTEQIVDEFEVWLPGAIEERTGSDTVSEHLPRLKEVYGRAVEPLGERSKAAQSCEYLAAQSESHWTVDIRLEGDEPPLESDGEYGDEDRVRFLMDSQGNVLGVQIADYTDAGYGYLDTFVGTVNVLVKDGVVSRRIAPISATGSSATTRRRPYG